MARQEIWEIFLTKPAENHYDHVTGEPQEQFDYCFALITGVISYQNQRGKKCQGKT